VTSADVKGLSDAVRGHAIRLMGVEKANRLADAIAKCEGPAAKKIGHKLANDAAQKLFDHGKLRQAEKAFLELVQKHGEADAYVGLARAQLALEDPQAALNSLRDGAAKFARANDRATAISLLAEAVELVPEDLAAHRRLAAALANQGDMLGAVEEYERFVDVALRAGDSRRALLELAYGRETLGDVPGLAVLVDKVTGVHSRFDAPQPAARKASLVFHSPAASSTPVPPPPTSTLRVERSREAPPTSPVTTESTSGNARQNPEPELDPRLAALGVLKMEMPAPAATKPAPVVAPKADIWVDTKVPKVEPKPAKADAKQTKAEKIETKPETKASARTRADASHTAVILNGARTVTHADQSDLETPVDLLARAGFADRPKPRVMRAPIPIDQQLSMLPAVSSGIDGAATAASRAALLTSARDTRATDAVLDAARRLLALGKLQSASDVLLDYIAHGFTDREAQRLLIEVDCALNRRDVAKEKCDLLSRAYRLDGRADVADDVERLARIL